MSEPSTTSEPGLVTVTFRPLAPERIVALAADAGLTALEWGGDVHCPPGDLARAAAVGRMTREAGLRVAAYGSYLRLGEDPPDAAGPVLDAAVALGAPAVRVWAGRRGSAAADDAYRARVRDAALALADRAMAAGLLVCYEHHDGTLTDTDASALALLAATDHPAVRTLWQPPHDLDVPGRCASLRAFLPRLHHLHVFHWPRRGERAALAEGAEAWRAYLGVLRDAGVACPLLLEFVRDDDPAQLAADAATLRGWIAEG